MTLGELKNRSDALAETALRSMTQSTAASLALDEAGKQVILSRMIALAACYDGPLDFDMADWLKTLEQR